MQNALLTALFISFASLLFGQSPVGTWLSFDDETGEVNSHLKITEKDGKLYCHIAKLIEPEFTTCTKCKGDKKDQPMVGLEIIWDLKQKSKTKWTGGKILDPEIGKTYKCKIEVAGDKLKVRGYLGSPMFGRTVEWKRLVE